MDPLKLKGQFYLPDNKTTRISGVLTFSHQEGIILELIGAFTVGPGHHQVILGHTSEGKAVSLYRNDIIEYTIGFGFASATYKSRFIFIGIYFDSQRDLRFRSLNCRFSVLNEWLYTENLMIVKHKSDQSETVIQFKPPVSKSIKLNQNLDLILNKTYIDRAARPPLKITFEETSQLKIIYKKRVPFHQLLDTLKIFQNLLTFVTQRQVYPYDLTINFRTKDNRKIHSANLQYQIPNYQDSIKKMPTNQEFLFSYSLIPQKIESLIYKWFTLGNKLALIMVEFCSQFYNPKMYQEDKFLSMTTCLESFHREFRFKRRMDNIDRYKSLYEEGRSAFNWIIKIPSKKKFCEDLRDYRNDLTHNNPERVLKTNNMRRLYSLTVYARVIVVTVVLRELGLSNKEIKGLFQKNMIFNKL